MANSNKSTGTGWGLIILCWVFFWPVGLILTILKLREDTKTTTNNSVNAPRSSIISSFIPQQTMHNNQPPVSPINNVPQSIQCSGCGAPNTVLPGRVTTCEYCGSKLTVNAQKSTNNNNTKR